MGFSFLHVDSTLIVEVCLVSVTSQATLLQIAILLDHKPSSLVHLTQGCCAI
uniref:Uncharacterized protein n=1 Tax=Rhizophora mucronata TaxID=61149 RepID=A0A2P2PSF1_RHIMU